MPPSRGSFRRPCRGRFGSRWPTVSPQTVRWNRWRLRRVGPSSPSVLRPDRANAGRLYRRFDSQTAILTPVGWRDAVLARVAHSPPARSLVAFPEASLALPARARQRRDDSPAGGVLRRRAQSQCCRIPHFAARRRARCTSGRETRSRRSSRHARTRRAAHACRPTDQRRARRVRHAMRAYDRGLTDVPTTLGGCWGSVTTRQTPRRSHTCTTTPY